VLIVEDESECLRRFVDVVLADPALALVGAVSSGQAAIAMADASPPDVVPVDLGLPDVDGIEVIRHVVRHHPQAEVLVVTMFGDDAHIVAAVEAGATGYLLKDAAPRQIVEAIHAIRAAGPGARGRALAADRARDRDPAARRQAAALRRRGAAARGLAAHRGHACQAHLPQAGRAFARRGGLRGAQHGPAVARDGARLVRGPGAGRPGLGGAGAAALQPTDALVLLTDALAPPPSDGAWSVYLPYLYNGGRAFLNGQPLGQVAESTPALWVRLQGPQLLHLPGHLLRAGDNRLDLRLVPRGARLVPSVPQPLIAPAVMLRAVLARPTPSAALLLAAVCAAVLAGVHDQLLATNATLLRHLLPDWSQRRLFLLHHAANLLLLVMGALLVERFLQALAQLQELKTSLERRAAEREAELERNVRRIGELDRQQARLEERQRLVQDMHDGLGSVLEVATGDSGTCIAVTVVGMLEPAGG
jgi:DNA-binding NarL/FixJ family response regulator